ncbi:MAG: c-type cytochrome [Cyanobacteriota bacterium]
MRRPLVQRLLPWGLGLLVALGTWITGTPIALAEAAPSGAGLFVEHCAGCHVNGGNILRRGKTLKLAALKRQGLDNEAAIAQIAANGIGQMGGYGEPLGAGGPEAVASWVWQQAQDGWPRS